LNTRRAAIVGGTVGLIVSAAALVLWWWGVAGVLRIGHINLMYIFWPSSFMLTTTWGSTVLGIMLTVISVALNVLLYGATATI
jgi:hypothetical protein